MSPVTPPPAEPSRGDVVVPPPRRLVRRAREAVDMTRALIKRARKRGGAERMAEVTTALDSVDEILSKRRRGSMDGARLQERLERLEAITEEVLGSFRKSTFREYVEAVAWAVVLALLIRSFLFEAFSIPSGSMLPTLEIGDRLFVNKIGYGLYVPFSPKRVVHWDEPERGDVIVFQFRLEGDRNDGEDYIKRIVAVAGDRVRMENNRLWVNGEPVKTERAPPSTCPLYDGGPGEPEEPASVCPCIRQTETVGELSYQTQHLLGSARGTLWDVCANQPHWPLREGVDPRPGRYFGEASENPSWPDVVIPEGHVFVMGDNRDRSEDGRYWGLVPYDRIKGTAFLVWWARDSSRLFTWLG